MPIMYHPADGRAVDIPQIAVTAALRDGFTMVPPSRPLDFERPVDEAFPEGGSAANVFVRLLERFFAPSVAAAIMASPGGVRPDLVNIAERRALGEFLAGEGDIPVPDFSAVTGVQVQPGIRFGGSVPDGTISEIGEKLARGRKRRLPPEGQLPTGFGGPLPDPTSEVIVAGGLTAQQTFDLQIACMAGDDAACDALDKLKDGKKGGGAARPKYVAPDERLVQDQVEAMLTALIGSAGGSQKYVDIYMKDDKRRWEGAAVDPGQSVLEAIRATTTYKVIHKNRPDFIKEGDWIGRQIVNLERQGLRASDIQQRAIDLATAGSTPTVKDASVAQVQATGQFTPEFMRRIGDAAATIAGTI